MDVQKETLVYLVDSDCGNSTPSRVMHQPLGEYSSIVRKADLLRRREMTDSNEKGDPKRRVSAFMIGNAIVWGAVIIGTSLALRGTGYMSKLMPILSAGAFTSIIILGGSLLRGK